MTDLPLPGLPLPDLDMALARLAGSTEPALIGVRHHSPVCAAAVGPLLDALRPTRMLIELPTELQPWLGWLGDPELVAPVALSGVASGGTDEAATADRPMAFYPFADFSPELVAIRWAVANDIPLEAFDLPLAGRNPRSDPASTATTTATDPGVARALADRFTSADGEDLWDRMVEVNAVGRPAEEVRRAALLAGWALRLDAELGSGVAATDAAREAHMRDRIAAVAGPDERLVAVVGAFHAAALTEPPLFAPTPVTPTPLTEEPVVPAVDHVVSLIAYNHELLDSRSGYPAGIRDPMWQQRLFEALTTGQDPADLAPGLTVEICRHIRSAGHVAGVPDAAEAVRMANELAGLRAIPAPGRRELLEAIQSCLTQGEPLGRGRIVARALERVLIGRRRGRLAPGTPRSGLVPHTEELLQRLRLPASGTEQADPIQLRLDPLRSALDRERHITLMRLRVCRVAYGTERAGTAAGGVDTLTRVWTVTWTPSTEATLGLAGLNGVTLSQAADGVLATRERTLERGDGVPAAARIELLVEAAEAGLADRAEAQLAKLFRELPAQAGLAELLDAYGVIEQILRGHLPGAVDDEGTPTVQLPEGCRLDDLLAAAVRSVEGLGGSDDLDDARALARVGNLLLRLAAGGSGDSGPGLGRFGSTVDDLADDGSPLMQGAAGALRVLLGRDDAESFGRRVGSWVDLTAPEVTGDPAGLQALTARVAGMLAVSGTVFEAQPELASGLIGRIETLTDDGFLVRLPALRGGFDVLSPAARGRLLTVLGERLGPTDPRTMALDVTVDERAELLGVFAAVDAAGRLALDQLPPSLQPPSGIGPHDIVVEEQPTIEQPIVDQPATRRPSDETSINTAPRQLQPVDRWRLILGRERSQLPPLARRAAVALDELYGQGHGEGSGPGQGDTGGSHPAYPSVREWSEELEQLFGKPVRQEVLARAAGQGYAAAALALDPDDIAPSVELLQQVLALRSGLPEAQLAQLRRLIAHCVDALVAELSTRMAPSLTGLTTARPTRRPVGPLDLGRTLRANLHTVGEFDGRKTVVPEQLIFRRRASRSMDWHIVLLVDVSGSMEPSVIYSAITAAILNGLPALSVQFVAFSTEVVDLTHLVSDPLSLLMEVSVGGGTAIASALRYARGRVRVPTRTLALVVSDFEEGGPIGPLLAEVRTLVGMGVTPLGLAALDDQGAPRYSVAVAEAVAAAGMPVAALSPSELAAWVGDQIRG